MPYQQVWVAPELFLSHNGVNVYRVYSDDDIDQGPKSYWFTTKPMESGEDCDPFDVRDLKVPSRALLDGHPPFISLSMPDEEQKKLRALWDEWQGQNGEIQVIRKIIEEAIDAGLIVAGEDNVVSEDEDEFVDGTLDWELVGKSMKAANIPGDIMPGETESQFVAAIIDELHARYESLKARSPCGECMRVKTWRGLRPITEFDEVEIHAMCEGEEDGELLQASDCPGESPVAYTVFLHCVKGGIETVHDFRFDPSEPGAYKAAKKQAKMLSEQLYDMLRAAGTLRSR